jgi:hypothetical protein
MYKTVLEQKCQSYPEAIFAGEDEEVFQRLLKD